MASIATMPLKDLRPPDPAPEVALPSEEAAAAVGMAGIELHVDWPLLQRLPMLVTAGIPLHGFKVKDLLSLKAGRMVESSWPIGDDVPLRVGSVQLSWTEFEVVEQRMAIRLTRLA